MVVRTTQKDGNDPDENEDRGAVSVDGMSLRLAVADGATESSFSDCWAAALVDVAIEFDGPDVLSPAGLERALQTYHAALPPRDELPWYAQEKLLQGSHAAFGLLQLQRGVIGYRWSARFVGDCQLFVLKRSRRTRLMRAVPAETSSAFGFHPALVATDPRAWAATPIVTAHGRVRPPFELWLATDALAHACLVALEAGRPSWDEWSEASQSAEAFEALVARKRSERAMRNDDVTLVRAWSE